jgi:hypothetical protein
VLQKYFTLKPYTLAETDLKGSKFRVARFLLAQHSKTGKIYQMAVK